MGAMTVILLVLSQASRASTFRAERIKKLEIPRRIA
jgi:hypothetical protein